MRRSVAAALERDIQSEGLEYRSEFGRWAHIQETRLGTLGMWHGLGRTFKKQRMPMPTRMTWRRPGLTWLLLHCLEVLEPAALLEMTRIRLSETCNRGHTVTKTAHADDMEFCNSICHFKVGDSVGDSVSSDRLDALITGSASLQRPAKSITR